MVTRFFLQPWRNFLIWAGLQIEEGSRVFIDVLFWVFMVNTHLFIVKSLEGVEDNGGAEKSRVVPVPSVTIWYVSIFGCALRLVSLSRASLFKESEFIA